MDQTGLGAGPAYSWWIDSTTWFEAPLALLAARYQPSSCNSVYGPFAELVNRALKKFLRLCVICMHIAKNVTSVSPHDPVLIEGNVRIFPNDIDIISLEMCQIFTTADCKNLYSYRIVHTENVKKKPGRSYPVGLRLMCRGFTCACQQRPRRASLRSWRGPWPCRPRSRPSPCSSFRRP